MYLHLIIVTIYAQPHFKSSHGEKSEKKSVNIYDMKISKETERKIAIKLSHYACNSRHLIVLRIRCQGKIYTISLSKFKERFIRKFSIKNVSHTQNQIVHKIQTI